MVARAWGASRDVIEMQAKRGPGVAPSGGIFTGENMSTMCDEIDFRMHRREAEASRERIVRCDAGATGQRLSGPRAGSRRHLEGARHALAMLGHGLHLPPRHPGFHGHRP